MTKDPVLVIRANRFAHKSRTALIRAAITHEVCVNTRPVGLARCGFGPFDLIPKALAFERADPATVSEGDARSWTRRSLWRLPLDIVTCVAMLTAFAAAMRGA